LDIHHEDTKNAKKKAVGWVNVRKLIVFYTKWMGFALVPKLLLGNLDGEAPASRDRKLELPAPNSHAGAWELANQE
jgi:hypothetical protein